MKKPKKKNQSKLFLLIIKSKDGMVLDILPNQNYDVALLAGMERIKTTKDYWEIFDHLGRYIDGSRN